MRLLNVKAIKKSELEEKWGEKVPSHWVQDGVFIRCNAKGEVKWHTASIYSLDELRKKGNVKINL